MITLLIFISKLRAAQYGVGTYIRQLSTALTKKQDVNIYIINYYSSKYKEVTYTSLGSLLTEVHIPFPIQKYGIPISELKYASRILNIIDKLLDTKDKVISLVNDPSGLHIIKEIKNRFSIPVVSVVHSAKWQIYYKGNFQVFNKEYDSNVFSDTYIRDSLLLEKEYYELSDQIISVTSYMKKYIIKYYNINSDKIIVIHNGIDNSDFKSLNNNEKIKLKRQLGFNASEKIILFSGRLDQSKGLYFLIDGFKELLKQIKNVRLILIGEDSGLDKISGYLHHCENIWSKITFTGFLEYEKVLKFYQIADIGIVPSIYDHCPYVVLEMIGHKIPLIISNTNGLNEILTPKQAKYLNISIDNRDNLTLNPSEIANAIIILIKNSEQRDTLIKDYGKLINTEFSAKVMADKVRSVLNKLV